MNLCICMYVCIYIIYINKFLFYFFETFYSSEVFYTVALAIMYNFCLRYCPKNPLGEIKIE